jgi:hypothetical protein
MQGKYYIFMYENEKMRHVETTPGMGVGIRENDREGEFH